MAKPTSDREKAANIYSRVSGQSKLAAEGIVARLTDAEIAGLAQAYDDKKFDVAKSIEHHVATRQHLEQLAGQRSAVPAPPDSPVEDESEQS